MYVMTDESGRIIASTEFEEYTTADYTEIDVPDDFDASKIGDYIVSNGELVYSPRDTTDEDARIERENARAAQMGAAISLLISTANLTDAQALTVSAFYDEWRAKDDAGNPIHYNEGDRRTYQGDLYRCREGHDSQESWTPADAHSLWAKIIPEGEIPEWEQPVPGIFDGYELGQRVTHSGKTWESTYNGLNVWEPGAPGTELLWREVS